MIQNNVAFFLYGLPEIHVFRPPRTRFTQVRCSEGKYRKYWTFFISHVNCIRNKLLSITAYAVQSLCVQPTFTSLFLLIILAPLLSLPAKVVTMSANPIQTTCSTWKCVLWHAFRASSHPVEANFLKFIYMSWIVHKLFFTTLFPRFHCVHCNQNLKAGSQPKKRKI